MAMSVPMRRILPTTLLQFLGFLNSSLGLAAIPLALRMAGWSATAIGACFGLQFAATLLARYSSARFTERCGPRAASHRSFAIYLAAALVLGLTFACGGRPVALLVCVALCRLLQGWAESYMSVCASAWGIVRAGREHTTQVLAWSGISVYLSVSFGGPLGLVAARSLGLAAVGALALLAAAAGWFLATALDPVFFPAPEENRTSDAFSRLFLSVLPLMCVLLACGVGFAAFNSLVTLYFLQQAWPYVTVAIALYGMMSALMRATASRKLRQWRVSRAVPLLLLTEGIGLCMLGLSHGPGAAMVSSALIGAGSSMIFPLVGTRLLATLPDRLCATGLGMLGTTFQISIGLAGLVAGVAGAHLGYRPVYLGAAVLQCITGSLFFTLANTRAASTFQADFT